MNTRTTPVSYAEVTAVYPSLFGLSGGSRTYGLNASGNQVIQYLPAPTAGTRLRFFAVNTTNAVTIRGSSRAPVLGSTSFSISLTNKGDCLELQANAAGTDWTPINRGTVKVGP
jgi:hypothetical protein